MKDIFKEMEEGAEDLFKYFGELFEYDDYELLSDCCGASIIHTDICSNCKEHCL